LKWLWEKIEEMGYNSPYIWRSLQNVLISLIKGIKIACRINRKVKREYFMKSDKPHLIWMPGKASGKVRTFSINFALVKILSLIIVLCICAIPVLETELISIRDKVDQLESRKNELSSEIKALQFVKNNLARIENKESALKEYFGMENYSSLDQLLGAGGSPKSFNSLAGKAGEGKMKDNVPKAVPAEKYVTLKLDGLDKNYEVLCRLSKEKDKIWEFTPSIVPVKMDKVKVSSTFGWRKNPFTNSKEFHAGVDFSGPKRTKIIAPAAGVVLKKGYDKWLGNFLVISHGKDIKTIYGHLDKITVDKGVMLSRGDLIGLMGNTGLSTNNHLHYAVINESQAVDPMEYILDYREG